MECGKEIIWGLAMGIRCALHPGVVLRPLLSWGGGGEGQGGFPVRSLVDVAGSYSVAHWAGLLPTELTGMWGWILLRSPHQGSGSPPAPAPTKQRPSRSAHRHDQTLCVLWCRGNAVA